MRSLTTKRERGVASGLAAALGLCLAAAVGCDETRSVEADYEHGNAQCSDAKDNDGDELIDCDDPGCKAAEVCGGTGDAATPGADGGPGDGAAPPPDSEVVPPGHQVHYFSAGEETADVDLLFMVDNSGSMSEEQTNLASNFPRLIDALRSASLGGDLPNLHVGVVTSDLGAGSYGLPTCLTAGGDGGKLRATPTVAGCTPPSEAWISYVRGKTNVPGQAADPIEQVKQAFACIARVGTDGCGFEHSLESARMALDPAKNRNPGFLRDGAVLALVMITDEDDCSARKDQIYDPTHDGLTDPLGPLTSFRCFEFGVTCDINDRNKVGPRKNCVPSGDWLWDIKTRYVDFLFSLKSPARVVVAAIAGPTGRVEVTKVDDKPSLGPSCQSSQGMAVPAIRLEALTDAVGAGGFFSSICVNDFGPALVEVADRINAARGLNCLRPLQDESPEPGLQPTCKVEQRVGATITPVPPCSASTGACAPCPCWRVAARAECQSGHALDVLRQGAPAPGTLVKATCKLVTTTP